MNEDADILRILDFLLLKKVDQFAGAGVGFPVGFADHVFEGDVGSDIEFAVGKLTDFAASHAGIDGASPSTNSQPGSPVSGSGVLYALMQWTSCRMPVISTGR